MGLKHPFVSAVADGADATLVRPSDWNADHVGFPALATVEADLDKSWFFRDFDSRVVASGWGQAQFGGAWQVVLGVAAVTGSEGTLSGYAAQLVSNVDSTIQLDVKSAMPTTAITFATYHRSVDVGGVSAGVQTQFSVASSGAITYSVAIVDTAGGGHAPIANNVSFPRETWVANTYFTLRTNLTGSILRFKLWLSSRQEPTDWDVSVPIPSDGMALLVDVGTQVSITFGGDGVVSTMRNLSAWGSHVGQSSGTFDVTGLSGLTAGKQVFVFQVPGPYTAKGTREDEAEVSMIDASGYVVDATTIRVYWRADEPISGLVKFAYAVAA